MIKTRAADDFKAIREAQIRLAPRIARVVIPDGYASAEEFAADVGVELAEDDDDKSIVSESHNARLVSDCVLERKDCLK